MKVLRRQDTAGNQEEFPLTKSRYGVGISWDAPPGGRKVDVDLQCVVVNNKGVIIDCAYYNNMKAARGITHSGDETSGMAPGIDEMVWINFPKLSADVQTLVFVVAAYSGGKLQDVVNGRLHIYEENERSEIAQYELERSAASVDVVAAVNRGPSGWTMRIIEENAQQGQHFMDILPLMADVIRIFIPSAPKRQKVAFAMEKGGILDLPQDLAAITVGLGWDTSCGEVDLDVSAVLMDASRRVVATVFFGQLECEEHGIIHSGDNLTGAGDGDDEQIQVALTRIGPAVTQVVFVINIYTQGRTFRQVANPYCRVIDQSSDSELCRYSLADAGNENGLLIAKIKREAGGRWGFHALGLPCRGRTYKDSLPQIINVCDQDTRALMARGGTAEMDPMRAPAGSYAAPRAMPPPQQQHKKDGCAMQ